MKFNSVKEYFYKLSNTGYQLMMVPLILFIYFYSQSYFYSHSPILKQQGIIDYLFIAVAVISLFVLTTVQINFAISVKKLINQVGLGLKLEKLGSLLITRMIWLALVTLLMPISLILSGDQMFSIFFAISLAWYFLHWPNPSQVSKLLKLKGDEKEMVLSRGEAFR